MNVKWVYAAAAIVMAIPARASIAVQATTDIWLAGQSNGSSVTGYFGTDFAPANSPVAIAITGGDAFSILGSTDPGGVSVDGGCFDSTADAGACYPDEYGFSPGPANGISLAHLPAGALVGVFVAAGGPSGPAPSPRDFTGPGGQSFTSLSPALDQLFFIGDGLTGTGSGAAQEFIAPVGAATLYLAVADSVGSSDGNTGSITADVTDLGPAPVPEPSLTLLVAGGLLFLVGRAFSPAGFSRP